MPRGTPPFSPCPVHAPSSCTSCAGDPDEDGTNSDLLQQAKRKHPPSMLGFRPDQGLRAASYRPDSVAGPAGASEVGGGAQASAEVRSDPAGATLSPLLARSLGRRAQGHLNHRRRPGSCVPVGRTGDPGDSPARTGPSLSPGSCSVRELAGQADVTAAGPPEGDRLFRWHPLKAFPVSSHGHRPAHGLSHSSMTSKRVCLGWQPVWVKTKVNGNLAEPPAGRHVFSPSAEAGTVLS